MLSQLLEQICALKYMNGNGFRRELGVPKAIVEDALQYLVNLGYLAVTKPHTEACPRYSL